LPERIFEAIKIGRASTVLKLLPVASKERETEIVVSDLTSSSWRENRPVDATVVRRIISDPTAAVSTGKCRTRADFQITTKKLGVK
jgi:hypothetical protein